LLLLIVTSDPDVLFIDCAVATNGIVENEIKEANYMAKKRKAKKGLRLSASERRRKQA